MRIWPAIDIRQGRVVQLVGGDPEQVALTAEATPAMQARHWKEEGARGVHVVDLDGAFEEGRQWHHVASIRAAGVEVAFGGGVRSMLDVQRLLDLGVRYVIVGTQAIENPEWLRELALVFPDRIVLAVDARGRDVQVRGWTVSSGKDLLEIARAADAIDLGGILYTNVEREGRLAGIDQDAVRALREAAPGTRLIVSGGIASMEDLAVLDGLGVDAVVLGMSVYAGAIDLREAVARFERHEPSERAPHQAGAGA